MTAKPFEIMAWAAGTTCGSASKKLLLLTLASYADEHWACWPSQVTLAEVTELGERTVRRLLAEMEDDGLLRREERRRADGYRTSDRIILRPPPAIVAAEPEPSPTDDNLTGQPVHISPATMAGQELPVGTTRRTLPENARGQLSLVAASQPPAAPAVPRGTPSTGPLLDFEAFWAVYPRKAGKRAAREAWAKAVKRANPADIIAGAVRYRDDPNRDDAYTKYPQGWLNADRWEDDPLPDRHPRVTGGAAGTMAALERFTRTVTNEPQLPPADPGWLTMPAIGGAT